MTPTPVNDFQAFVPVNTGALEVRSPATGYQGTAFTELGIERTKVVTCLDWKDSSNTLNMTVFASEYLATVQDIVYEGALPYFGLLAARADDRAEAQHHRIDLPHGLGFVRHPDHRGGAGILRASGATNYITTVAFSNRRAPFSGAALKRPAVLGQPLGIGLTELRAGLPPPVPSAAGQWSPAAAASDQDGATDSNSGDSPVPVAALGGGPAPDDALAGSLPGGSQASPTDPLVGPAETPPLHRARRERRIPTAATPPRSGAALGGGPAPSDALAGTLPGGSQTSATDSVLGQTDSTPAPLSGGATPSPETGVADEPADDEGGARASGIIRVWNGFSIRP